MASRRTRTHLGLTALKAESRVKSYYLNTNFGRIVQGRRYKMEILTLTDLLPGRLTLNARISACS